MEELRTVLEDTSKILLQRLVTEPEKVSVSTVLTTKTILIQVQAEKKDYGKIIGKRGRMVTALRLFLNSIKNNLFPDDSRKVLVELIEEEGFVKRRAMYDDEEI